VAAPSPTTREEEALTLSTLLTGIEGIEPTAVASALLDRFGSAMDVLTASRRQLTRVAGGRHEACDRLHAAHRLLAAAQRGTIDRRPLLSTHDQLTTYLRLVQGYLPTESLRLLHLDARLRLSGEDVLARGGPDYVDVDLRELVHLVLDAGSTVLILAHNHPSGSANPSGADKLITSTIAAALKPLGVCLVEHLIIAREEWFSFRRAGLL
jgi:DNA repair protein RadC